MSCFDDDDDENFCPWHCMCRHLLRKRPFPFYQDYLDRVSKASKSQLVEVIKSGSEDVDKQEKDKDLKGKPKSAGEVSLDKLNSSADTNAEDANAHTDFQDPAEYDEALEHGLVIVEQHLESVKDKVNDISVSSVKEDNPEDEKMEISPAQSHVEETAVAASSEIPNQTSSQPTISTSQELLKENGTVEETDSMPKTDLTLDSSTCTVVSHVGTPVPVKTSRRGRPKSSDVKTETLWTRRPSSGAYNCRNRAEFHKCVTCGKMFGQLSSLRWHEKEHNLEEAKHFECVECGKSYTTLASYERHLKVHPKCLLCGKSMTAKEKEIQGNDGIQVNVCKKCKNADKPTVYRKGSQSPLSEIRWTEESSADKPKEEEEDKIEVIEEGGNMEDPMDNIQGMETQMIVPYGQESKTETETGCEQNDKLETFPCTNCDTVFASEEKLAEHLATHKEQEEKESEKRETTGSPRAASGNVHQCRYCWMKFGSPSRQDEHEETAHSQERPIKCPECPLRFKNDYHRKRHMVVHTSDTYFKCKLCSQKFSAKNKCRQHVSKVHGKVGDDFIE